MINDLNGLYRSHWEALVGGPKLVKWHVTAFEARDPGKLSPPRSQEFYDLSSPV